MDSHEISRYELLKLCVHQADGYATAKAATFDRRIHKFSWPEATSGNILGLSWAGQAAGRIHDCRNQLSGLRTLMAEAGSEAQRSLEQLQPLTPNDPLQRVRLFI